MTLRERMEQLAATWERRRETCNSRANDAMHQGDTFSEEAYSLESVTLAKHIKELRAILAEPEPVQRHGPCGSCGGDGGHFENCPGCKCVRCRPEPAPAVTGEAEALGHLLALVVACESDGALCRVCGRIKPAHWEDCAWMVARAYHATQTGQEGR